MSQQVLLDTYRTARDKQILSRAGPALTWETHLCVWLATRLNLMLPRCRIDFDFVQIWGKSPGMLCCLLVASSSLCVSRRAAQRGKKSWKTIDECHSRALIWGLHIWGFGASIQTFLKQREVKGEANDWMKLSTLIPMWRKTTKHSIFLYFP